MKNIFKTSLMALAGLVVFTACEDDRDSNPVLNTSGNVTFQLNAPEVGASTVDLARSEGVALTWSQPVLTEDNAPLGLAGVYGFQYVAQLSKDGNFTKSFTQALAEVTDENGDYTGTPTGHNFTTLPTGYTSCASTISGTEINRALNELYLYEEGNLPEVEHAYIRMVAQLVKTNGEVLQLATSNAQELNLVPSEWVDVTAQPVEVGYLWVPGNGNGWNHGVCPILVAEDGVTFKGYAYMNGEFKFTVADNWNDGELNNGSFTSTTENVDLGDGGGGNLNYTGEASMCWIEVTPSTGELLITPVTWSIIGGFNSWGDDAFLTYDESLHCLTLTYDFDSDTEFKFRRDSDWAVNFGGTYDALEQDGPNFNISAGTHTFKLFLERPSVDGMYAEVQ